MSRKLLILALLLTGSGCSTTHPLLSPIVAAPPRLSFRQQPRVDLPPEDSWHWTAVAVTYPSESMIPAPCMPSPVRSVELVTYFEEDECLPPLSISEPVLTTAIPVLPANAPAPVPPATAHLNVAASPLTGHLPVPGLASVSSETAPIFQATVAVTSPSASLLPPPCTPSPVILQQPLTFIEKDECPALTAIVPPSPTTDHHEVSPHPSSVNLPVPSVSPAPPEVTPNTKTISTISTPSVQVESLPLTESDGELATSTAFVSPVQTSTPTRSDQDEMTLSEVRQAKPVESLSPPVVVHADLSELLTEIRNQRRLIESLQLALTRERSADDAAINELEAAVENLLVQTQAAQRELPTSLRK